MKINFKWLWMLFIICFAIPSFVIVYCYSKFVLNVSRVNRDVKNFDQNSTKKRLETPARLTVLVAILCLAFFWKGDIFSIVGVKISRDHCLVFRQTLTQKYCLT